MIKKSRVVFALLVLCSATLLPAEQRSIWKGITPAAGARDIGILFSTNDILFDIEGYQQGLGVKISLDKCSIRLRGVPGSARPGLEYRQDQHSGIGVLR